VTLLLAVLVVFAFAGIVGWTRLPAHAGEVVHRTRGSYAVVSDRSLSDEQKERRLKEEAPRLFALLGRIVAGSLLALGLPLGALWVVDRLGLASLSGVLEVLVRVDFLVAVSALGVLWGWWLSRRRR
jgi:hypothetical protein